MHTAPLRPAPRGTPRSRGTMNLLGAARPRARGLAGGGGTAGGAFGPRGFARRCGARCARAARGGALGLPRQRLARHRAARLALQCPLDGAGDARTAPRLAPALACLIGVFGALARAALGLAFPGRLEVDAGAPGLGQPDGDRLPGRPGAMLAATNVLDLLAHELARLGARRLAGALVAARPLDGFLVRHSLAPIHWLYDVGSCV